MSNGTLSIPTNLSPSHHILLQKQQEYAGLVQLREASAELLNKVEKLSEMSHIMADGGEAIGQVMKNWPHVFSILNLFDSKPGAGNTSETSEGDGPEPIPTLVRLPYRGEAGR